MSMRTVLIVVLALVCGGAAVIGINSVRPIVTAPPSTETAPVVVASEDIGTGVTMTASMLKLTDWPKDRVPPKSFKSIDEAVSRVAMGSIFKDEVILDSKLSPVGSPAGVSSLIPNGMRAVTLPTPSVATGVAGILLPKNKVDVLLTVSPLGDERVTGGPITSTLLHNVEVFAVDRRIDPRNEHTTDGKQVATPEFRSVTLLVTSDQAAVLSLGQNRGILQLILRNPLDPDVTHSKIVTINDLPHYRDRIREAKKQEGPEKAPAPRVVTPADERAVIRTLRGSNEGTVEVYPSAPGSR